MTQWRKASYSGTSEGTDCVELASLTDGVGLRDSKAPQEGHLTIEPHAFAILLTKIKAGTRDL
ncbi:DUF397 domain-containing protein [Actinomadura vinacea]|uniref:DUF397 domain-containing protein n=1 Tax=Actinomadura vinacea TaxID=115336 RepID=A0ABN3JA70_9ACTN